ncbi:MAG TPA: universal stress protein [Candidatus Angelobacter sp.]|nr:universal stress protein [Candidatus Angelobacter sp.]
MSAASPKPNNAVSGQPEQLNSICNLIIPLDGTVLSRSAIPVARVLSEICGATPHVIYAGQGLLHPNEMSSLLGVGEPQLPGAVFDCCNDDPAGMIMEAARNLAESLIVMCTHSGSHPSGFGHVADSVLASGPERIVMVPPERGERVWSLRRILLAHDGTPDSDLASGAAAEISMMADAEVTALHVAARQAARPEQPGSLTAPRYIDQPQHEWPAWTQEFVDRMLTMGAPASAVRFKLVVAGGRPGSEIAQLAREKKANLIVMAWDGEWQSARHVATRVVIRSCGCPVLLVRSRAQ